MKGSKIDKTAEGGVFAYAPLFVAAAHELKSPLALVRQLALELEGGSVTPAQQRQIAQQITLTSERALRLTADRTKQARLEDSLFALEPLSPLSVCEEVVVELRPLYKARGRSLQLGRRNGKLLGLANRDLLRRILVNFADNALHYTQDDSPVVITVQATEGGKYIRLGVRDYGPAVPTQMWQKLKTSLGTTAQPVHARPGSSGLGIYIAGQFAEAMQARIGATRHRDGATFYVDIATSAQLRLL